MSTRADASWSSTAARWERVACSRSAARPPGSRRCIWTPMPGRSAVDLIQVAAVRRRHGAGLALVPEAPPDPPPAAARRPCHRRSTPFSNRRFGGPGSGAGRRRGSVPRPRPVNVLAVARADAGIAVECAHRDAEHVAVGRVPAEQRSSAQPAEQLGPAHPPAPRRLDVVLALHQPQAARLDRRLRGRGRPGAPLGSGCSGSSSPTPAVP